MPDESALRLLIGSLEQQIAAAEIRMYFWTAMVILGCAGELLFVVHAYLEDRRIWSEARTRAAIPFPEKPSFPLLLMEIISVACVVIGISGELYIDWKSGDLQTQLRNANGNLVLLLEREAGEAKASAEQAGRAAELASKASGDAIGKAAKANERAATLEGANRAQQGELARLSKEASDAKAAQQRVEVQLAAANRSVAVANLLADQERVKELALEETLSPRVIGQSSNADGTRTSFDSLRPFSWAKAKIDFPEGDAEARRLAKGIEITLKMAGWQITPAASTDAGYFDGVSLVTRLVNSRSHNAAEAVADFLGGCSIDAFVMVAEVPDLADDETLLVHVGLKPMPNALDHLKDMAGGLTRWTKNPLDLPCH